MENLKTKQPAEQIFFWADKLRDLSATGLRYVKDDYDQQRYEIIQEMAIEMTAFSMGLSIETLLPLKGSIFSRMAPNVAGAAAVIDENGKILLMRRTDNKRWAMPGGQMEVGEMPAEAVVRETFEETGVRCIPKALVGVYDSRIWSRPSALQHAYLFTFLYDPLAGEEQEVFDEHETLEIGWFAEDEMPEDLLEGHIKRISDSFKAKKGYYQAYFDL